MIVSLHLVFANATHLVMQPPSPYGVALIQFYTLQIAVYSRSVQSSYCTLHNQDVPFKTC